MDHAARDRRRRQWIALILSGLFPGLGQLYLRAWGKGAAFLLGAGVVTWGLGGLVEMDELLGGHVAHPLPIIGLLTAFVALSLWSLVDAWRCGGEPQA